MVRHADYLNTLSTALILVSTLSFVAVGLMMLIAPEFLDEIFKQSIALVHGLGLIGSLLIMTIAALTAFPAELPAIACGAMYGLLPGFFVAWLTAIIGSSVAFSVGRHFEPTILRRIMGESIFASIRKHANQNSGIMALFLVRLIPFFPFFIVNIGSGMSGMPFRNYILATSAGIIPGAFISSAIGAGLAFSSSVVLLITASVVVLAVCSIKIYRNSIAWDQD